VVESGRRILHDYSAEGRKRRKEMFPYLMTAKKDHRAFATRHHLTVRGCLMQNILIERVDSPVSFDIDKYERWLELKKNGRQLENSVR
jgi:hypothetical protein